MKIIIFLSVFMAMIACAIIPLILSNDDVSEELHKHHRPILYGKPIDH